MYCIDDFFTRGVFADWTIAHSVAQSFRIDPAQNESANESAKKYTLPESASECAIEYAENSHSFIQPSFHILPLQVILVEWSLRDVLQVVLGRPYLLIWPCHMITNPTWVLNLRFATLHVYLAPSQFLPTKPQVAHLSLWLCNVHLKPQVIQKPLRLIFPTDQYSIKIIGSTPEE